MNEARLEGHEEEYSKWMPHIIIGLALVLAGILVVVDNALALNLINLATAGALLVLGIAIIWKAFSFKHDEIIWINMLVGTVTIIIAVVIYYFPSVSFWLLLLILAIWTLGSGLFLIFGRGDKLQFDAGSIAPITIGIFSLMLAILLILNPVSGLNLVIVLAGTLVAFMGLMELAVGVIHRSTLLLTLENQS